MKITSSFVVCCILVWKALVTEGSIQEVFSKCTSHKQCPTHSLCSPSACDGYTCRCTEGYVTSDDNTQCLPVKRMGDKCNTAINKCLSPFSLCKDTCVCADLFESTKDGRCKDPLFRYVGETCWRDPCEPPTQCGEDGRCQCPAAMRELTSEEIWLNPMKIVQCVPKDYSVHSCNGVLLEIPPDLLPTTTTPTTTTTTTTVTTTTTPMTTSTTATTPTSTAATPRSTMMQPTTPKLPQTTSLPLYELIYPNTQFPKRVFESCGHGNECPKDSECRPHGCNGYMCLCNEGYIASDNRNFCLKATRIGEPCDKNTTKCLSPFSYCDEMCRCIDVFVPTSDGRCKLPEIGFHGESCTGNSCEYPAECINGKCTCQGQFRSLTSEEFWVDPFDLRQCRKLNTSLDTCNGKELAIPVPMRTTTATVVPSTSASTTTFQAKTTTTSATTTTKPTTTQTITSTTATPTTTTQTTTPTTTTTTSTTTTTPTTTLPTSATPSTTMPTTTTTSTATTSTATKTTPTMTTSTMTTATATLTPSSTTTQTTTTSTQTTTTTAKTTTTSAQNTSATSTISTTKSYITIIPTTESTITTTTKSFTTPLTETHTNVEPLTTIKPVLPTVTSTTTKTPKTTTSAFTTTIPSTTKLPGTTASLLTTTVPRTMTSSTTSTSEIITSTLLNEKTTTNDTRMSNTSSRTNLKTDYPMFTTNSPVIVTSENIRDTDIHETNTTNNGETNNTDVYHSTTIPNVGNEAADQHEQQSGSLTTSNIEIVNYTANTTIVTLPFNDKPTFLEEKLNSTQMRGNFTITVSTEELIQLSDESLSQNNFTPDFSSPTVTTSRSLEDIISTTGYLKYDLSENNTTTSQLTEERNVSTSANIPPIDDKVFSSVFTTARPSEDNVTIATTYQEQMGNVTKIGITAQILDHSSTINTTSDTQVYNYNENYTTQNTESENFTTPDEGLRNILPTFSINNSNNSSTNDISKGGITTNSTINQTLDNTILTDSVFNQTLDNTIPIDSTIKKTSNDSIPTSSTINQTLDFIPTDITLNHTLGETISTGDTISTDSTIDQILDDIIPINTTIHQTFDDAIPTVSTTDQTLVNKIPTTSSFNQTSDDTFSTNSPLNQTLHDTIPTNSNVRHNLDDTIPTNSNISHKLDDTIPTNSNISHKLDDTIPTNSNVNQKLDDTIPTNSNISQNLDDTIPTNSNISHKLDDTFSTKSNISHKVDDTFPTYSTINKTQVSTITTDPTIILISDDTIITDSPNNRFDDHFPKDLTSNQTIDKSFLTNINGHQTLSYNIPTNNTMNQSLYDMIPIDTSANQTSNANVNVNKTLYNSIPTHVYANQTLHDSISANVNANQTLGESIPTSITTNQTLDDSIPTRTITNQTLDDGIHTNSTTHQTLDDSIPTNTTANQTLDDSIPTNTTANQILDDYIPTNTTTNQTLDDSIPANTTTNQTLDGSIPTNTTTNQTLDDSIPTNTTTNQTLDDSIPTNTTTNLTLDDSIPTNTTTNQTLDDSIPTNTTTNQTLDDSIPTNTTTNQTLDDSIPTSTTTNQTLDNSIPTSTTTNQTLDDSIPTSTTTNQTLDDSIPTNTTAHQTLDDSIPTNTTTNQTLDDRIPTNTTTHQTLDDSIPTNTTSNQTLNDSIHTNTTTNQTLNDSIPTNTTAHQTLDDSIPTSTTTNQTLDDSIHTNSTTHQTLDDSIPRNTTTNQTLDDSIPTNTTTNQTLDDSIPTNTTAHQTLDDSILRNSTTNQTLDDSIPTNTITNQPFDEHIPANTIDNYTLYDSIPTSTSVKQKSVDSMSFGNVTDQTLDANSLINNNTKKTDEIILKITNSDPTLYDKSPENIITTHALYNRNPTNTRGNETIDESSPINSVPYHISDENSLTKAIFNQTLKESIPVISTSNQTMDEIIYQEPTINQTFNNSIIKNSSITQNMNERISIVSVTNQISDINIPTHPTTNQTLNERVPAISTTDQTGDDSTYTVLPSNRTWNYSISTESNGDRKFNDSFSEVSSSTQTTYTTTVSPSNYYTLVTNETLGSSFPTLGTIISTPDETLHTISTIKETMEDYLSTKPFIIQNQTLQNITVVSTIAQISQEKISTVPTKYQTSFENTNNDTYLHLTKEMSEMTPFPVERTGNLSQRIMIDRKNNQSVEDIITSTDISTKSSFGGHDFSSAAYPLNKNTNTTSRRKNILLIDHSLSTVTTNKSLYDVNSAPDYTTPGLLVEASSTISTFPRVDNVSDITTQQADIYRATANQTAVDNMFTSTVAEVVEDIHMNKSSNLSNDPQPFNYSSNLSTEFSESFTDSWNEYTTNVEGAYNEALKEPTEFTNITIKSLSSAQPVTPALSIVTDSPISPLYTNASQARKHSNDTDTNESENTYQVHRNGKTNATGHTVANDSYFPAKRNSSNSVFINDMYNGESYSENLSIDTKNNTELNTREKTTSRNIYNIANANNISIESTSADGYELHNQHIKVDRLQVTTIPSNDSLVDANDTYVVLVNKGSLSVFSDEKNEDSSTNASEIYMDVTSKGQSTILKNSSKDKIEIRHDITTSNETFENDTGIGKLQLDVKTPNTVNTYSAVLDGTTKNRNDTFLVDGKVDLDRVGHHTIYDNATYIERYNVTNHTLKFNSLLDINKSFGNDTFDTNSETTQNGFGEILNLNYTDDGVSIMGNDISARSEVTENDENNGTSRGVHLDETNNRNSEIQTTTGPAIVHDINDTLHINGTLVYDGANMENYRNSTYSTGSTTSVTNAISSLNNFSHTLDESNNQNHKLNFDFKESALNTSTIGDINVEMNVKENQTANAVVGTHMGRSEQYIKETPDTVTTNINIVPRATQSPKSHIIRSELVLPSTNDNMKDSKSTEIVNKQDKIITAESEVKLDPRRKTKTIYQDRIIVLKRPRHRYTSISKSKPKSYTTINEKTTVPTSTIMLKGNILKEVKVHASSVTEPSFLHDPATYLEQSTNVPLYTSESEYSESRSLIYNEISNIDTTASMASSNVYGREDPSNISFRLSTPYNLDSHDIFERRGDDVTLYIDVDNSATYGLRPLDSLSSDSFLDGSSVLSPYVLNSNSLNALHVSMETDSLILTERSIQQSISMPVSSKEIFPTVSDYMQPSVHIFNNTLISSSHNFILNNSDLMIYGTQTPFTTSIDDLTQNIFNENRTNTSKLNTNEHVSSKFDTLSVSPIALNIKASLKGQSYSYDHIQTTVDAMSNLMSHTTHLVTSYDFNYESTKQNAMQTLKISEDISINPSQTISIMQQSMNSYSNISNEADENPHHSKVEYDEKVSYEFTNKHSHSIALQPTTVDLKHLLQPTAATYIKNRVTESQSTALYMQLSSNMIKHSESVISSENTSVNALKTGRNDLLDTVNVHGKFSTLIPGSIEENDSIYLFRNESDTLNSLNPLHDLSKSISPSSTVVSLKSGGNFQVVEGSESVLNYLSQDFTSSAYIQTPQNNFIDSTDTLSLGNGGVSVTGLLDSSVGSERTRINDDFSALSLSDRDRNKNHLQDTKSNDILTLLSDNSLVISSSFSTWVTESTLNKYSIESSLVLPVGDSITEEETNLVPTETIFASATITDVSNLSYSTNAKDISKHQNKKVDKPNAETMVYDSAIKLSMINSNSTHTSIATTISSSDMESSQTSFIDNNTITNQTNLATVLTSDTENDKIMDFIEITTTMEVFSPNDTVSKIFETTSSILVEIPANTEGTTPPDSPENIPPKLTKPEINLEGFIIPAIVCGVFILNLVGVVIALARRKRRKQKHEKPPPSTRTTTVRDEDLEGGFKIPRPNVLFPPYYVRENWNTWTSSHYNIYESSLFAQIDNIYDEIGKSRSASTNLHSST